MQTPNETRTRRGARRAMRRAVGYWWLVAASLAVGLGALVWHWGETWGFPPGCFDDPEAWCTRGLGPFTVDHAIFGFQWAAGTFVVLLAVVISWTLWSRRAGRTQVSRR